MDSAVSHVSVGGHFRLSKMEDADFIRTVLAFWKEIDRFTKRGRKQGSNAKSWSFPDSVLVWCSTVSPAFSPLSGLLVKV